MKHPQYESKTYGTTRNISAQKPGGKNQVTITVPEIQKQNDVTSKDKLFNSKAPRAGGSKGYLQNN